MSESGLLTRVFERLAQRDLDARLGISLGAEMVERLIAALDENGFAPITGTWQAAGAMKAIGAEDLRAGMGEGLLFELTAAHGLSPDEVTELLGHHLPQIVRQLRTSGAVSPAPDQT